MAAVGVIVIIVVVVEVLCKSGWVETLRSLAWPAYSWPFALARPRLGGAAGGWANGRMGEWAALAGAG